MMPRVPVLPNVITAFSLTCGLFVIFKINMTPVGEADLHVLTATAGFLLLSAFADLLDGTVARMLRAESYFGGIFDSLADGITFGVCPPVIVLKSLSILPGTEFSFLMTTGAIVYTVSGILRLARFNVMSLLAKDNPELTNQGKKNFTGLPIPAAAAAIVSLNLFLVSNEFKAYFTLSEMSRAWILFVALISVGYFMICRLKFPSLKTLHIKVASFQAVFLIALAAVFLFYGIMYHFPVAFILLSWSYILIALILSTIRLIAGRKNQALEDFEPEPEE